MPPTPEQLQITESAQLTPQQPQVSAVPDRANYVEEGVVSMPSPQMWMGDVDPGDNWWNLGSSAAKAGMAIYTSVNDGLLASRRQNAENDMNNLQNISLEKPESPDMTPYQLKEWQQGQQRKLNNATYNSLVNQGLSDEDARGVLDGTKNPAGFKMYASDIQNILHLTRYQGQTNASMVNDIQRYDNAIWTGSVENFYNADNNMYGAYNGLNTEEVTNQYNKHMQDVIDATGYTRDELKTIDTDTIASPNKRDRVMLARYLMDKNNYQDSMKESIKQTTDKILNESTPLYSSAYNAMLSGDISREQFLEELDKTSTYIDDQIKLETKLQTQPYGLDSSTTLEERKQARLLENPNQAVDILFSRRQASNEKMMLLTEALSKTTSVDDLRRIENLMQVEQQNQFELDELGSKIDIGFLTPNSQQKIESFKSSSWKTLQAAAKTNQVAIQTQFLTELEIDRRTGGANISNAVDLFMQLQTRTGTLPTKKEWQEIIKGKPYISAYDDINSQLPETRDDSKTSRYSKIPISQLTDTLTRMLTANLIKKNGIPLREGVLDSHSQLDRIAVELLNKNAISQRASSTTTASEQTNGYSQASGKTNPEQDLREKKQDLMDDKPGVLPSEVDKVTSNAFNNYLGTLQSMPEDNAWVYRASPKTASLIGATLRNPADRMAFFEKTLSGTITPDLILKYAKETRALLSSGQKLPEGSSKADMEYAANYLTFIANKIGFNGTQRVMEEHKMDPTVINKQWDIFTMRRDTAFRTISTFKQNTNLTQAQQDAGGTMLELLMGNYNSINQGKDLLNIVTHVPIGADVANTVLRDKIKSLGLDSWNSTEDLLTTLVNFTKQDPTKDYLSPTIIGLLSAQPGDTIDQIQSRIQEYESFNGLRIEKRWVENKDAWFSNGTMYPVLSTDTMGRATMGESAPRMNTGLMTPDSWANPMNQVKMNYDNYVYGKRIPGRKTSDGKDIMDTDNNFTVTNDNMIDAYRSALPMSTSKELLKRDGSKGVVVLNALMKVYDAHESREERVAHMSDPNHPFYKWAMQFPVGPDGKPSPIGQSRINWLFQVLSQDELSYTTAIELGLNDPSHIGVNTSLSRPQLESQARFKSLPMYDAEYTRNTNMQDDAGIQQSSNYTRLPDGSYYYDPTSNEPVLVKNEQGNYMDQAGNAAFKLGTNPDLNTRLSDRWLESNAGSTWELVNPLTGVSEKRQIVFGKQNEGTLGNYTEMIINQETNTIEMHEYRALPPKRFALSKDKNFQHIVKQLYPKKLLEYKNYDLPTPAIPKPPIKIDPNKPELDYQQVVNNPDGSVSVTVDPKKPTLVRGIDFYYEETSSIYKMYEKHYGTVLAKELFATAEEARNQNPNILDATVKTIKPSSKGKDPIEGYPITIPAEITANELWSFDQLRKDGTSGYSNPDDLKGELGYVPDYNNIKDKPIAIYRAKDELTVSGFVDKRNNPGKLFLSNEAGVDTTIHEMTHETIHRKNDFKKQNFEVNIIEDGVGKKFVTEMQASSYSNSFMNYVLTPVELPSFIAGMKAEYFKDTNKTITNKNVSTELPDFTKWIEQKASDIDTLNVYTIIHKVLNKKGNSKLKQITIELIKQIALNQKDNNTWIS